MIKVLFVCHGNICRSPMAEYILKDKVNKMGMSENFIIASAATSCEEIWNGEGNPVHPMAKEQLKKHGISCDEKRAIQLEKSDYDKYDYLIAMDSENVRNMLRLFSGDKENKIHKLMEFTGKDNDVSDPWYTRNFKKAYEDIEYGVDAFLKKIIDNRFSL